MNHSGNDLADSIEGSETVDCMCGVAAVLREVGKCGQVCGFDVREW